ncbi:MAG: nicotinate-nucleotide adenylyltransferase [Desulforegulaceae bacterium]|nr:nicotinate-nucleotide adenylyltransferase [Desulforegulaceae bacterium]
MDRSETEQRTGIFGGTFNPFHKGHLNAAEAAFKGLNLKELIFIPVYLPPHKGYSTLASSEDRIEIIKKSIEGKKNFFISDLEIKRKGLSYTIDTLKEIKSGKKGEFFFIMGSDSFLSFNKWHRYKDILKISGLAVASRPGFDPEIETLGIKGYYLKNKGHYSHKEYKDICFFKINEKNISSTGIRKLIKQGQSLKDYLDEKAADYIEEKGLYKDEK